jgi:hypothetical protein
VAVYAGLVLDLCHSLGRPLVDRRPNLLTLSQLSVIMLRTCKRSIRTGVNDLSGLYTPSEPGVARYPRLRQSLALPLLPLQPAMKPELGAQALNLIHQRHH